MLSLESCAQQSGSLQGFHPTLKIVMSLTFILCIMSCQRENLLTLAPYAVLLCLGIGVSQIPMQLYICRLTIALPFSLFAGIWGCFWDLEPVQIMGIYTTGGILSFCSILLRTLLCVGAILILVGTTPIRALSRGMRQLHVPMEIICLFELMCRYLGILIDETTRLQTAWQLRGGSRRGIAIAKFGSFVGSLFIRSFQRASRVYQAMQCRGYGDADLYHAAKPTPKEWIITIIFVFFCLFIRIF